MFQTIIKLYDTNIKKIIFGGTIIYCDKNNVCSIYYDNQDNKNKTINIIESLHESCTNTNTNTNTKTNTNTNTNTNISTIVLSN